MMRLEPLAAEYATWLGQFLASDDWPFHAGNVDQASSHFDGSGSCFVFKEMIVFEGKSVTFTPDRRHRSTTDSMPAKPPLPGKSSP